MVQNWNIRGILQNSEQNSQPGWSTMPQKKRIIHQTFQKHPTIYFVFLISQNSEPLNLL
jgi:hypothetical protein